MSAVLQVEFVSVQGHQWRGTAHEVQVPLVDGSLGILPRRQPLLAEMGPGTVTVKTTDAGVQTFNVDGGLCSVDSDFVTIVTRNDSLA